MFKKLLLVVAFSFVASNAFAVCGAIPLPILDGTGASRNMSSKSGADGNCVTNVDADASSTLLGAITSPVTLGSASAGMTYKKLAALTNTAVAVDAAAGQLYELYCYNPNATVAYVQVYDTAQGSVTVGTTAAVLSYGMPATSSSGFTHSLVGIQFSTAITVAATTAAGNATAPGTALDCNAVYK